ncbi:BlaI/MecI/CopY family transcriptional regulator [Clostridioides difficile]|uniref:BlaI/MecI/CopY family transcriptional regulator n=1 Tax=Clostridioides difficile TaxID=1496 RepID=UPI001FADFC5C|nr:BlaI/MecI/CopY family transcriptional regulator [Clostridioides difficile]MCJ0224152.1 BlaI/MecI/CopY family transcriptional regulator [Clostridioides difficile]MCJ0431263.1 BlaI/MecI/CopY family transcriptional regulator [Clostridioides difficile]MCJ0438091.1 BlaI/MecI/CopY family transcriptional regulator [Clostridioides difficile]MCU6148692.1 BlaI/MecI/CopY family transcriptional regulator [Clostridioides difficile]
MDFKKLPESELKIMKFIWELEQNEVASGEVVEAMKQLYGWNKNTTLTILSKLTEKNYLYAQKTSKCTFYTIAVREKEYLKFETKKFFSFLHNNSLKSLLTALHEEEDLSEEKIKDLDNWIKNWEDDK